MPKLFDPKRLTKINETVQESWTEIQFNTRKETALRLKKYLDVSTNDEDFYSRAWNDFPVWSVAFIDDDSNKPLFPALWQCEYAYQMDAKKYSLAMCSRKVGKSTLLSVKNLHNMCGLTPQRVVCFAPTLKQDYVFSKMGKYLLGSEYLEEVFVGGSRSGVKQFEISLLNGSSGQNKTIGLQNKGELVRGEYADVVTVDEVQKIEPQVMRQIIFPIIADAYSPKKLRMLGTPNPFTNPNLEAECKQWELDSMLIDSEYSFMRINWERGVAEGCLDEKYVLKERERMTPDEFAMEYEARFPEQGSRFYDMALLETCTGIHKFATQRSAGCVYGLAVDWAKFVDRTQIVVGELDLKTKIMKYIAWLEIDPKRGRIDYEQQVSIVKRMFHSFGCEWMCPDATSNQDSLIDMLISGENAIPTGLIYATGDRRGYCASDVLNDEMWRNHRQQMTKGRILVPTGGAEEQRFAENWKKEHNELAVKKIRNGTMVKLEEPVNGHKDLAVACGMLSMMIPIYDKGSAYMDLEMW